MFPSAGMEADATAAREAAEQAQAQTQDTGVDLVASNEPVAAPATACSARIRRCGALDQDARAIADEPSNRRIRMDGQAGRGQRKIQ